MATRRKLILQLLGLAAYASRRPARGDPAPVSYSRQFSVPLVDDLGQVIARYPASASYFVEDLGAGTMLDMALIPSGSFQMGSLSNTPIPPILMFEQPVHRVSINPFALGTFPVTVGQWRQVSTYPRISNSLHGVPPEIDSRLPMDVVFWDEIQEFCQRLQVYTGRPYRLPSEAEWEYACRAGTTTKYHFGEAISQQVANYNDGITRPLALTIVGSKQAPNRFGLHDMHGNVLEQCSDWVHASYDGAPQDGSVWVSGGDPLKRVARGGSYLFGGDTARSAARYPKDVREAFGGGGFRVALDVASGLLDPTIREDGVLNAASGVSGPLAPGEIITIFGRNIGPSVAASAVLDEQGYVGKVLSARRVLFDGLAAPLLYVSTDQINAVVPYAVAGKTSTQVMVESQGQTSAPVSIQVVQTSPAIFTVDSSGKGQGAVINEDGTENSSSNPAQRGSTVSIFATGEGQTDPPGMDGKPASSAPPAPVSPVQVFIGDVEADIRYVGGAPDEVAGVLQINIRIPETIEMGQQQVLLRIGGASSQRGVFMSVG